jgi:hypothetical protein
MGGFEEFLKAIQDPNHEQHKEMLEWVGVEYDPLAFDPDCINHMLKQFK